MSFQYFTRRGLTSKRMAARTGLALLLLPGLFAAAGCGTQAQNALKVQGNLMEAQRSIQVDATDAKARQDADAAIAVAPNDPTTYFGSGAPASPSDPALLSIADVFASVGDNPALADYMTQATKKFPTDVRGFQILEATQGQMGQTAAQKATAAQLVALLNKKLVTPGTTDIESLTEGLGQAYFDAGDPAHAIAVYQKAIQAYPTQPGLPNDLAYNYALSGTHLPEALALANQAIALAQKQGASEAQSAAYQDTLGWVLYRQGHYPEAEQHILQAADALPRLAEVHYHLGQIYAAEGKMEAARAELGHAVLLAQDYTAAQTALAALPKSAPSKDITPKSGAPAGKSPKAASAASS